MAESTTHFQPQQKLEGISLDKRSSVAYIRWPVFCRECDERPSIKQGVEGISTKLEIIAAENSEWEISRHVTVERIRNYSFIAKLLFVKKSLACDRLAMQ